MKQIVFLLLSLVASCNPAFADVVQDASGNSITSQASGSQRALDIGINVGGVQVDPRTRTWSLLNSTDSVNAVQSGVWSTGRTWSLLNTTDSVNAVQSGTWTTGRTWALTSASDSIAAGQLGTWTTGRTWTTSSGTDSMTVVQGNANTVANAWPVLLTDGVDTANITATSTAAASSDKALVVAQSPNHTSLTGNSPGLGSVGTTSAQLVAANTARKGLVVMNNSVNTIAIGIGVTAVLNSGIVLYPGGIWYMDAFTFSTAAINAISTAATSPAPYQEMQ